MRRTTRLARKLNIGLYLAYMATYLSEGIWWLSQPEYLRHYGQEFLPYRLIAFVIDVFILYSLFASRPFAKFLVGTSLVGSMILLTLGVPTGVLIYSPFASLYVRLMTLGTPFFLLIFALLLVFYLIDILLLVPRLSSESTK